MAPTCAERTADKQPGPSHRGLVNAIPLRPIRTALPTLTSVYAVHHLSAEQAARQYPVHLVGVITFRDPNMEAHHTALFIHDSTGSMYVDVAPGMTIGTFAIGTVVEVWGVTDPGGFKPIVRPERIQVTGTAPLPLASRLTLYRPTTRDGWIEVEGIVRSVIESDAYVKVQLEMLDGSITAKTLREPDARYAGLVDAKVRIRANSSPLYNRQRQVVGARLMFANLSALQVIEPSPADPFSMPVHPIGGLFRFRLGETLEHRVHLQGWVTLQWPGSLLCIRDRAGALCARTQESVPFPVGTYVDLVGFAAMGDVAPTLTDAIARPAHLQSAGSGRLTAEAITAEQAMLGAHDSKLVEIEGTLIGRDRAASDMTLVLSSGNLVYDAVLPKSVAEHSAAAWKDGSRIRLTGVCSVQSDYEETNRGDGLEVPKAFRILLRSPADVVVLQSPSWWTSGHLVSLLTALGASMLAITLWSVMLRRQVREQTFLLRESEEKFRYLAGHDGLTTLPNRNAILAALEASLQTATQQRTRVCVAILDLDHFKQVNDTFGHNGGDEVLREAALRLSACIRGTDAVGRYGGEEFLVVFRNVDQQIGVERCEHIRSALCGKPVLFDGRELAISCSIGISSTAVSGESASAMIAQADDALYRAKANGRNRVEIFSLISPLEPAALVRGRELQEYAAELHE